MELVRVVDSSVYPPESIRAAIEAYKDYCHVRIEPLSGSSTRLSVAVLPAHTKTAREVALSFFNFALDVAAQIHLRNA